MTGGVLIATVTLPAYSTAAAGGTDAAVSGGHISAAASGKFRGCGPHCSAVTDGPATIRAAAHGGMLHIELDALPWFLARFCEGVTDYVLNPPEDEVGTPEKPIISWDFRGDAWVYKPGDASGEKIRSSGSIRCRTGANGDLAGLHWEDAMQTVYDETVATLGLTF
jgi:hypothetical protein